ncbi:MAG: alpha/beta hydrolase, partial [Planctomycetales bacterium]|nr:alpha/beta hydrolase [Planctomycetales bacterium]
MRLRATDGLCLALAMLWLGVHSASSLAQSDPNDSLKPRRVSLEPRDDVEQQTDVVYATYGERQLKLDLFLPRNEETGRSAVVVVHGGGWLQGDRTRFHALAQALAARGFVTSAIEYRLGGEAKFPAAIRDCNAAVRWLRANAERLRVDPQKIGAVGGSAGGHLVALMAAAPQVASLQGDGGNVDQSSALQAAVVMAGPLELTTGSVAERSRTGGDSSNANRWFGKTIDEAPELYELASPYT